MTQLYPIFGCHQAIAFEFGSLFNSPSQKGHKLAELPGILFQAFFPQIQVIGRPREPSITERPRWFLTLHDLFGPQKVGFFGREIQVGEIL